MTANPPRADRAAALEDLLDLRRPLEDIVGELTAFGWDSEDDLVTLGPERLLAVLARAADGELSPEDVSAWAEAIEGREDIGFQADAQDQIEEAIFALANPEITEPLDAAAIERWSRRLAATRRPGT